MNLDLMTQSELKERGDEIKIIHGGPFERLWIFAESWGDFRIRGGMQVRSYSHWNFAPMRVLEGGHLPFHEL